MTDPKNFSDALASRLNAAASMKRSAGDLRRKVDAEAAFKLWASLGPTRTYAAVAREMDCDGTTILRIARRMAWDKRLAELEEPERKEDEQKLRQLVRKMNERHIEVAHRLVEKGMEALNLLEPTSVAEALRLVEQGAKLERLARGEADSKKQITVEAILRERFEALVLHAEQPKRVEATAIPRVVAIDVPDLDSEDRETDDDE